jgi:hypothetical protein
VTNPGTLSGDWTHSDRNSRLHQDSDRIGKIGCGVLVLAMKERVDDCARFVLVFDAEPANAFDCVKES